MKFPRRLLQQILVPVCSLLATGLLVAGCASASGPEFTSEPRNQASPASDPAAKPVATSEASATNDNPIFSEKGGVRFQVGDQLIITFSGNTDQILPHEERIKEDGNITLPLIGAVKALGKSDGELQTEIHDRYVPKYYVRLTVTVKYDRELSYSVLGEVKRPGPTSYTGKTTVTKAIGAANGLTEFANKSKLVLTRANGTRITVNYKKAIKDPKFDPQIFPGDSIYVEKTWY